MPVRGPNFSRYSRAEAALVSRIARWMHRPVTTRALANLVGDPVTFRLEGPARGAFDPHAAVATVRAHGMAVRLAAPSLFVRDIAQRLLKGPTELPAPRALTAAERGVWAVLASAALTDAGLPGEVWPDDDEGDGEGDERDGGGARETLELTAMVGGRAVPIRITLPPVLATRVPPPRPVPAWTFDLPILVGACSLPAAVIAGLRVRDVVTIERRLALVIGPGLIDLQAAPGAVEAKVVTVYNRRPMAPPNESAELELTVQLGTTRVSLAQLAELAPGAIVSLGRPLAGPFEVRAAGRLIGQGELVDVDGELGVRIVSLQE